LRRAVAVFLAALSFSALSHAAERLESEPWEAIRLPKGEKRVQIKDPANVPWLIKNVLDRDDCPLDDSIRYWPLEVIRLRQDVIALANCRVSVTSWPVLMVFGNTSKEPRIVDLPRMAASGGFTSGRQQHGYIEWDAEPGVLTITEGSDMTCGAVRHVYAYDGFNPFTLTEIKLSTDCGQTKGWSTYWRAEAWPSFVREGQGQAQP